jgi:hypothetical protein
MSNSSTNLLLRLMTWEQDYRKYTIPTSVRGKVFPTDLCGKVFPTDLHGKSSPTDDLGKIRTLLAVAISSCLVSYLYNQIYFYQR